MLNKSIFLVGALVVAACGSQTSQKKVVSSRTTSSNGSAAGDVKLSVRLFDPDDLSGDVADIATLMNAVHFKLTPGTECAGQDQSILRTLSSDVATLNTTISRECGYTAWLAYGASAVGSGESGRTGTGNGASNGGADNGGADNGGAGSSGDGTAAALTYKGQIKTILDKSCALAGCHNGTPGLSDLRTYAEVKAKSAISLTYVNSGLMPKAPVTMTAEEKAAFKAWVNAGSPEGTALLLADDPAKLDKTFYESLKPINITSAYLQDKQSVQLAFRLQLTAEGKAAGLTIAEIQGVDYKRGTAADAKTPAEGGGGGQPAGGTPGTPAGEKPKSTQPTAGAPLTFADVKELFLTPAKGNCAGCHAGALAPKLSSAPEIIAYVTANKGKFMTRVTGPTADMPKGAGSLSAAERAKIQKWVDDGLKPEPTAGNPQPAPKPAPLADFATVQELFLARSKGNCGGCHPGAYTDEADFTNAIADVERVVFTETGGKKMPKNYSYTADELAKIRSWVDAVKASVR